MKNYILEVELDISDVTVKAVHNLKTIAENNGCDVFNHGYDRLVIGFDRMINFTKCVNEMSNMFEAYDISYVDLLV